MIDAFEYDGSEDEEFEIFEDYNLEVMPDDMIREACTGGAKIGLFSQIIYFGEKPVEDVDETITCNSELSIHKNMKYVYVDIIFPNAEDFAFHGMNNLLKDACSFSRSIDDNMTRASLITLMILPERFDGDYYITGVDPVFWGITANDPNGELAVLRLVFCDYDFYFLENDLKGAGDNWIFRDFVS